MGYQYVHIETYGRKSSAENSRSVSEILDELERRPGAHPHVKNPKVPVCISGLSTEDLRAAHDKLCEVARTTTSGKPRKVRVDQHTILSAVASYPVAWSDPNWNRKDYDRWEFLTLAWALNMWGKDLVSVMRHDDEAHPHLHLYALPSAGDARAKALNPAWRAKHAALEAGATPGQSDEAYVAAMRALQDGFHDQVGLPCGQARIGPGRRRLSRLAWRLEQQAAEAAQAATRYVEAARVEAKSMLDRAYAKGIKIIAAANQKAEELSPHQVPPPPPVPPSRSWVRRPTKSLSSTEPL